MKKRATWRVLSCSENSDFHLRPQLDYPVQRQIEVPQVAVGVLQQEG
ncbi:hypothetical protein AADU03_005282, partial [Escherichia coli]